MGLAMMTVLMLLTIVLRKRPLVIAGFAAMLLLVYSFASTSPVMLASFVLMAAATVTVLVRYGLLAVVVSHATFLGLFAAALLPDAIAWYTLRTLLPAVAVLALSVWAFRTSLGGQRAFAASLEE